DGARVDQRDAPHELVLVAGQVQVGAVVALGLDLRGGADDHDGDVGGRGGLDGGAQLVLGRGAGQAVHERGAHEVAVADGVHDLERRVQLGGTRCGGDPRDRVV